VEKLSGVAKFSLDLQSTKLSPLPVRKSVFKF